jgi:HNH endonuclease
MPRWFTPIPISERIWRKTRVVGECLEWTGNRNIKGYGLIWLNRKKVRAHRIAYELTRGPIGDACVLHHCDNPPCINPDHLFLGTPAGNSADMVSKGRGRTTPRRGEKHHKAKLTWDAVAVIRSSYATGVPVAHLATYYGVSIPTVYDVLRQQTWRDHLASDNVPRSEVPLSM